MNLSLPSLIVAASVPVLIGIGLAWLARGRMAWGLLLSLLLVGGLVSFVITTGLNRVLGPLEESLALEVGSGLHSLVNAFLTAALAEEAARWITALVTIVALEQVLGKPRRAPEPALLCGLIGLGFAVYENGFYSLLAASWLEVLVGRTIPTLSHAAAGVIMGWFLQLALAASGRRQVALLLVALLAPVMLHGLYDFGAFVIETTDLAEVSDEPSDAELQQIAVALGAMLLVTLVWIAEQAWACWIVMGLRRRSRDVSEATSPEPQSA